MINILIADPIPLFTKGVQHSLSSTSNIRISGVCHSYGNLIDFLEKASPDILLIDESMEFASGKKTGRNPIWRGLEGIKIIVVYTEVNLIKIRQYVSAGVNGHLLKSISSEELEFAVQEVTNGKIYIQESIRQLSMEHALGLCTIKSVRTNITRRELQVIQLIVEEYSTQEIASKLFISFNTVESHRKSLILKLGVKNSAGIVREAIRLCLYPNPV